MPTPRPGAGHTSRPASAGCFTGLASAYAQHRPTYPPDAISYLLDRLKRGAVAIDIGCGTGISSRLLADRGCQVIGVDPNDDMLNQARKESPATIEYRRGTGEHTGLQSDLADLVLCAQSFHWLNPIESLREFHRVLKPAGRLALMWNVKDESNAFSVGFVRNSHRAMADAATRGLIVNEHRAGDPTIGQLFHRARTRSFRFLQALDLDGVLGRARSASYFPKSGPLRDELECDLRELHARHHENGFVELRYRTEVTLADRVP